MRVWRAVCYVCAYLPLLCPYLPSCHYTLVSPTACPQALGRVARVSLTCADSLRRVLAYVHEPCGVWRACVYARVALASRVGGCGTA